MNAKVNSGPLSYQIRTDISSTTAKVIIPKVHASSPKLLLYCILGAIHTDSELLVTKLFKNFFQNYYHIKTSQLTCIVNQLTGFFMVQIFTEAYFGNN